MPADAAGVGDTEDRSFDQEDGPLGQAVEGPWNGRGTANEGKAVTNARREPESRAERGIAEIYRAGDGQLVDDVAVEQLGREGRGTVQGQIPAPQGYAGCRTGTDDTPRG